MIGSVKTGPVLKSTVDALTRLEYRGYDSFGVAVIGESIEVKKDIGSVSEKTAHGFFKGFRDGMVSVAHTRWATHGGVTKENAHPHVSHDGAFAVVHNGVIENYRDLKSDLEKSGVVFASETDTEVIAHILVEEFTKARNVRAAIRATAKRLKGEYALVIATVHEPLRLYGARRKSPLGVTLGSHGGMFASDQRGVKVLIE